ncbi:MAG: hypothetical protein H6Q90_4926 [Deltaproteobacteria bacterium]|nr:hypothetical protein [Deltaproteobacteria bacterium]
MSTWFKRSKPVHPVLKAHVAQAPMQDRIADGITRFAGSMLFVYVHVVWFAVWIGFSIESFPYGLLTMMVSLEAIFLSTFLLISQNRADERRQLLANAQWELVQQGERQNELEVKQNTELLDLSRQILQLSKEIRALQHRRDAPDTAGS